MQRHINDILTYQRYTKYIYAKYNFQINKEDIYGKKNENHGW